MRWRIERFTFGLVAGWLFTFHGDRLGPDLFTLGAADPFAAALKRAFVLLVCGTLLVIPLTRAPLLALGGALVGFVCGRLVLGWPGSSSAWTLVPLALAVLLALTQSRRLATTLFEARDPYEELPTNIGELLCYALAGGGAALSLEAVARHLRLLSAGVARDEHVFDAVFIALAWIGAAAFGWMARHERVRKLAFPVLLGAIAATSFVALRTLDSLGDIRGIDLFLRRFGSDTSWHGTLSFDALVATATYVAPAFVFGAAVCATRSRASLCAALSGASIGVAVLPWLMRHDPSASTGKPETFAAHFVVIGTLIAVVGAALGVVFDTRRTSFARITGILCALLFALPTATITVKPLFVLSPWQQRPTLPFLAFETPGGIATVEPVRGNFKQATLDRRALTTELEDVSADSKRIDIAFELLSPAKRSAGKLRVLWVGQMSAVRARWLANSGVERVDRSASWWPAMERLEHELFLNGTKPAGEIVAPKVALERLEEGLYDLVIVPPVSGDLPSFDTLEAPTNTVVVRWFGIDEPPGERRLPVSTFHEGGRLVERRAVVLASHGFEGLSLGLVTNGHLAAVGDPQRPLVVDIDLETARVRPLTMLLERKVFRLDERRVAWVATLARGARGTPHETLFASFELFQRAQAPSSPWESPAEQIELPDAVLTRLEAGSAGATLDAATRSAWEWLAAVLVGKRDVQRIDRFLKPLAAAHAPWDVLEWALARADLEALEPESAARRLQPLATPSQKRIEIWFTLAEAEELAGRLEAAARSWGRAHEISAFDTAIERRLAMALARIHDPSAQDLIQKILAQSPEDDELKLFTGPGPYPQPRYTPAAGGHD